MNAIEATTRRLLRGPRASADEHWHRRPAHVAAMLGLGVAKDAFVATATAIALCVDAVRIPVYLATGWERIVEARAVVFFAIAGVVDGTVAGVRVLRRIPEPAFRKIVAAILLAIGIARLAYRPAAGH